MIRAGVLVMICLLTGVLLTGCVIREGSLAHDPCYWRARAVAEGAPDSYTQSEAERDCRAWDRLRGGDP